MTDARQDLYENIMMALIGDGMDVSGGIKERIYVILGGYEVQSRTTEVALLSEDRNEFLIRKFMVGKTVKGCTKRTLNYYESLLRFILPRIGKTVDDITADDIRYYIALRQKRDKISKCTADNELRCLRTFFAYLTGEEILQKNPMLRIESIKGAKTKKEAFTDIEVEKIRMSSGDERELAIIEMMLSTGCRVSELVQIRITDIDGEKVLVHGKGEKDRYVYLNAKAQVALTMYLECRKDGNPYLFPGGMPQLVAGGKTKGVKRNALKSWWKEPQYVAPDSYLNMSTVEAMMRKIAKKAGVKRANPHKFRRTCATMALRRGMPLEQVSKMLGHENISTTQIYLDLREDELEMAHKKYVV